MAFAIGLIEGRESGMSMSAGTDKIINRWRLILGRYAEKQLNQMGGLDEVEARMDAVLDYLYSREYGARGVRRQPSGQSLEKGGGLGSSQLTAPRWIAEARKLFPKETLETLEKHALQRYGLTDLVKDPETLKNLEPNQDLLKALLTFKGDIKGPVLIEVKRIIREVTEEIKRKIQRDVENALMGNLNRFRHSPLKVARNLDWCGTIRRNLKNYNPDSKQLVLEELRFFSRIRRHLPWDIILCVDQSGSMLDSMIHSAVMAGILHSLPSLRVQLVVFDTSVVDLSGYIDDPVEVLLNVQLGGGTDIGRALAYCEQLIRHPRRTILILLSDFEEGASPRNLISVCHRLGEAGVRLLGLASLDEEANPNYDRKMAERLSENGMEIAALTPKRLAEWLGKVIA